MRIKTISSIDDLHDLIPEWEQLVDNSVEQNINYEPAPLVSLLKNIDYHGWFVVCVWSNTKLSGFFPMQMVKRLPLPTMQFSTLFQNHFMSCIPLVHNEHRDEALIAFWDWVNSGTRSRIFYFSELLSTSELGNQMLDLGKSRGVSIECSAITDRAIGNIDDGDFEAYLQRSFSAKSRSSTRRKLRKLEKLGTFQIGFYTQNDAELIQQLDNLIQIEGSGWKRETGSAIALHPGLRQFMCDMASHAAGRGRIIITTGFVDNIPVSGLFGLINDGKLLIYKIGYDENYARYSVGQSTMLGLIEHAMSNTRIHTIDSCAEADSVMFNRCLPDRQTVNEYQIASNHMFSKICVLFVARSRTIRLRIKKALFPA